MLMLHLKLKILLMAFTDEHKAKFDNLRLSLEIQNREQLKRTANGGNSILFAYEPSEEILYLDKAREILDGNQYHFIDIAKLLVQYIDMDGWEDFKEYYNDFLYTPHLVFSSDDEATDLMDLIINEIKSACDNNQVPVLIRTGVLYATGIENLNIMEHHAVMTHKQPLIVFYPAKMQGDNLLFLNFKPASKYRCTVID
jgi:hypothetical protein